MGSVGWLRPVDYTRLPEYNGYVTFKAWLKADLKAELTASQVAS